VEAIAKKVEIQELLKKSGAEKINFSEKILKKREPEEQVSDMLPKEWYEKIITVNEEGRECCKKIVLYATSMEGMFCNSGNVLDKLEHVWRIFQENEDVVLWWFPFTLEGDGVKPYLPLLPDMAEKFADAVRKYQEMDIGIFDDSGDLERAIYMCDAFYGDKGIVASIVEKTGKCMMYQNYEIY